MQALEHELKHHYHKEASVLDILINDHYNNSRFRLLLFTACIAHQRWFCESLGHEQ